MDGIRPDPNEGLGHLPGTFGGLGTRLRAARLERGLSQEALAKPWFTKSYISAVERNKVRPSLKALELIARRLEVPVHELLAQASLVEGEPDLEAMDEDMAYQLDHVKWLTDTAKAQEALQLANGVAAEYDEYLPQFSTRTRYRFYYLRGRAYLRLNEPAAARADLGEALDLAREMEDGPEDVERVRNLIGCTYYEQDMPRRSLEHHELCLRAIHNDVVKDLNLKLAIYSGLANDYWALGDMTQAIGVYKEALGIVQDTNNLERQSAIYWGLSLAHHSTGDLNRAKLYGAQALGILEAAHNLHAAAQMRVNLAAISISRGEYDEAERLLQEAASTLQGEGDALSWSVLDEHTAVLNLKRKDIDEAAKFAQQSLELAAGAFEARLDLDTKAQAHAARTYARALRTAGLVAEARGNRVEADQLINQALELLQSTDFSETVSEIEFDYAELLVGRGDHQDAAAHYRAAYQFRQRRRGG